MKKVITAVIFAAIVLPAFYFFIHERNYGLTDGSRKTESGQAAQDFDRGESKSSATAPATTTSIIVPATTQEKPGVVSSSITAKAQPKGLFLLPQKNATLATIKGLLDDVDGLVIIATWKEIEPQEGVYDFSLIDQKLELVKKAGKQASLYVFTGKNSFPSWVSSRGVKTWMDSKGNVLIHPTDRAFVELWGSRVAMLGARYDRESVIRVVTMCGTAGTLCGPRYPELPSDASFEDLKSVWTDIVDSYTKAFPNTLKHLEVHLTIGHDAELPLYLLGRSGNDVGIFAEFLSEVNPVASSPVPQVIKQFPEKWCGFQMVSPLREKVVPAIAHGSSFGCDYFEVYQGDVSSGYLPVLGS